MRRNVTYHHTGHHSVKDAFQQVLSRSLGLLLKRDRMWRKIISLCLVVIIGGAGIGSYFFLNDTRGGFVPLGLSIVMSMMLTALPLLICYAQTISLQRQAAKLDTLKGLPVANTAYFKIARDTLSSINPATLDRYYTLPMLSFAFVIMFCWLMTTVAYYKPEYFQQPNVILGGFSILDQHVAGVIETYQRGTFVAGCFGFMGAYIYTNWQLLDRINNNDIYPISFYFYSARILAACFIAGTIRHVLPDYGSNISVILLSFASGFVPDIFITSIIRKASETLKVRSDNADPKPEVLPSSFTLLMIQGLDHDKLDRLSELYVTNAEVLACQNPFMLWLRLPYELLLIIDWISQAQLYRVVKEEGLSNLRKIGVCGSLDFALLTADADACMFVAKALGVSDKMVAAVTIALKADPTFTRLAEIHQALSKPF
jgi:hypothetical protein